MPLFRAEALDAQDRLHGEISLSPPVSWQIIGYFLLATVAASVAFLSAAHYAQTTVVSGTISSTLGLSRISPLQSGYVEQILVRDGQHVRKGEPVAIVSLSSTAASPEARRAAAVDAQRRAITAQAPGMAAASRSQIAALEARIAGDAAEASSLSSQIEGQEKLIQSAVDDLEKILPIADRGFVSGKDLRQRKELVVSRRQELSRLNQTLSEKSSDAAQARADVARLKAQLAVDLGQLEGTKAAVERDAADDANLQHRTLYAPGSGTVTGLTAHIGDPAPAGQTLLTIVPDGTALEATLNVPPQAAGTIEPGQAVRISVDAFPEQTYGTLPATLREMSAAAVPLATGDGTAKEFFVGHADLGSQSITAYGTPQRLRPGMTITARIRTRSRSLVQWLLDPLYAVARR